MDRLIRKRKSLERIKRSVSNPFLISIITCLVSIIFYILLNILIGRLQSIIYNGNINYEYLKKETWCFLFLFPTILTMVTSSLVSGIWQFPYLISSLWKIFNPNWFD